MANERDYGDESDGGSMCANPRCAKRLTILQAGEGSQKVFCSAKCEQEAKLIRENELFLRARLAGEVS